MEQKKIILFLFDRLLDPVIQSNIFQYINEISINDKSYKFHLITYEHSTQEINSEKYKAFQDKLCTQNIELTPLKYLKGQSVLKKMLCILSGAAVVLKLRLRGYRHIISLGTVSGSFAYLYASLLNLKLFLYQHEPHSEFMLDLGEWKNSSLSFKTLHYLEKKSAQFAKVIASGTTHMLERLSSRGVNADLFHIPSVVNEHHFRYSKNERTEIRSELKIDQNAHVFAYMGKFGGLYYDKENFDLFDYLSKQDAKNHILILTPHDAKEVKEQMLQRSIPKTQFSIRSVAFENMPKYLSASDFGIISIPPTPAQKFRSPIKVGEYLCCGIPYLTVKGVSEDDVFAEKNKVGVVVNSFCTKEFEVAYPKIHDYLNEKKEPLRERCRKHGIQYRGYSNLFPKFQLALERLTSKKIKP